MLAGGTSSRMGSSKAHLPFGPEPMLLRVLRLLSEVVSPIVVVGAAGQDLPPLPPTTILARDQQARRGPLEGLAAGFAALPGHCQAAFACSCDVPLLRPAFVRRMFELLQTHQIAVPHVDGFYHPLAAVYRLDLLAQVNRLLAADRLRPIFLLEQADARIVGRDQLVAVDPKLDSLRNCNRPQDYRQALNAAGLTDGSPEPDA